MSKNVTSFLAKLDKLNEKTIEVFVPSLKKKIPTRPLNLKQQKDLISVVGKVYVLIKVGTCEMQNNNSGMYRAICLFNLARKRARLI